MFKKSLATALLVAAVPAVASASWFLSTQAMNQGGTVTTRNGAQTVVDGSVFKSYTTSAGIPVTITADDGFTIKSVTVNGVVTNTPGSPYATTIAGSYGDKSVSAVFAATTFGVSASFPNGMVSPAAVNNLYKGYVVQSDLTFTFSPRIGYAIGTVTGAPVDANVVVVTDSVKNRATVTFKKGYVFTSALNLSATATATAAAAGFDAIAPKNVVPGATVTLSATGTGLGSNLTWAYVSGPQNTVTFGNYTALDQYGRKNTKVGTSSKPGPAIPLTVSGNTVSFAAPSVAGQYKFTVTDGTYVKMATVNVSATYGDMSNVCQNCHSANGIGRTTLAADWSASAHNHDAGALPGCSQCHYGTDAGAHPGTVSASSIDKNTFLVTNPAGADVSHYGVKHVAQGNYICTGCHSTTGTYAVPHDLTSNIPGCAHCHTTTGTGDAHTIAYTLPIAEPTASDNCATCHTNTAPYQNKTAPTNGILPTSVAKGQDCTACHDVAQKHVGNNFVNDNNGVRAVVGEFSKWSHHIVNPNGAAPVKEQCAVCHLEGTVKDGVFQVDPTKHMSDNRTHLRNVDTDADFAWNPEQPDHTLMDNFCLSCHDSDGATSPVSQALQALISPITGKTASPSNPFGDTLSNRYDKMQRPAVVDAKGQFDPKNPSHHAVRGQRYSGRTRVAGDPRAVKQLNAAFNANSSATLVGKRSTIYDSRVSGGSQFGAYNVSKFVETYETLSAVPGTSDKTLGDDSVLHCGDCHTVGQYRQADVGVMPKNNAVIGAHGSNNEYLLRNFAGTDERHVGQKYTAAGNVNTYVDYKTGAPLTDVSAQPWLVCFNCHSYQNYGSIGNVTGLTGTNHAGEYANSTRCNGPTNTIPFQGYTTGAGTDGDQYKTRLGEGFIEGSIYGSTSTADTDYSNLFGIQCSNCHNSGLNNAFGGIHGAKVQTYTDANGKQQKAYRFLPGLGNTMFVPGSAAGLGTVSDINWEQKQLGTYYDAGKTVVTDNSGCYTLVPDPADAVSDSVDNAPYSVSPTFEQKDYTGNTNMFGTWGGCDDHRGNAHGKAFAQGTQGPGNKGVVNVDPANPGTVNTGGAGAVRKVLRPVTY